MLFLFLLCKVLDYTKIYNNSNGKLCTQSSVEIVEPTFWHSDLRCLPDTDI